MSRKFYVSLAGLPASTANKEIARLRAMIDNNAVSDGVSEDLGYEPLLKESSETQDFGATLILLLGTPAVIALAKGIRDYIARSGNCVVVKTPQGIVELRGDAAKNIDVEKTVAALKRGGERGGKGQPRRRPTSKREG